MRITWLEMKKALLSPTILILTVIFIAFNIFTILNHADQKEELKIANDIVKRYGLTFNDEILLTMQTDLNKDAEKLDAGSRDAGSFLESMTYEKYDTSSGEEQKEIDRIQLVQTYISTAQGLDERYESLNLEQLEKGSFSMLGAKSDYLRGQYEKLHQRLEEIKSEEEYKHWFFLGSYQMHSDLFRGLIKNIAFQGMLLIVLLTAMITNYEFENRSQLVTYATKRGRRLLGNKLAASLLVSLVILVPLILVSLLTYFTIFDYSGLWNTPISSGLNWEYKWPYITWQPIKLWEYVLLAVLIVVMTLLIVCLLAFIAAVFLRNSYITWIVCILFLISLFVLPFFLTYFPSLILLSQFNITLLLLNPHMYFSGVSGLTMMEHHEIWTMITWFFISMLGCTAAFHYFNRKDIV